MATTAKVEGVTAMRKIFKAGLISLSFVLFMTVNLNAQETGYSMSYTLKRSPSGGVILSVTTDTVNSGLWLGMSLYPPSKAGETVNAKHAVFPIKKGRWIKELAIDPTLINGTFEAAVWTQKISGDECPDTDTLCKQAGFRLKGMISYIWGYLTAP
jgi:hypothetical protein